MNKFKVSISYEERLRDEIAMGTLFELVKAFFSHPSKLPVSKLEASKIAYRYADAMLETRKELKEKQQCEKN